MSQNRILLIDDEAFVLEELTETFECEGFEVTTALSGEEALKIEDIAEIPVVISDLKMPGLSGIDLFETLKERSQLNAKVILLSGHGAQDARDKALDLGFFACLSKPIDIEELIEVVETALATTS